MKPEELLQWYKEGGALHYDCEAPLFSFLANATLTLFLLAFSARFFPCQTSGIQVK